MCSNWGSAARPGQEAAGIPGTSQAAKVGIGLNPPLPSGDAQVRAPPREASAPSWW